MTFSTISRTAPLARFTRRAALALAAANVVVRLIVDPAVGHPERSVEPSRLEPVGQIARYLHLAHKPTFALHCVPFALAASEFAVQRRPLIGAAFACRLQRQELMGA